MERVWGWLVSITIGFGRSRNEADDISLISVDVRGVAGPVVVIAGIIDVDMYDLLS